MVSVVRNQKMKTEAKDISGTRKIENVRSWNSYQETVGED
jgi:hypothetical protein